MGVALCHTHPDAIEWFRSKGASVRVFRDELFFHPKVYLFTDGGRYAAFVGSSNLTHGGFHGNVEVNTLIEGAIAGGNKGRDIQKLQTALDRWHSSDYSFEPTNEWLEAYRSRYQTAIAEAERAGIAIPPIREEAATSAGWLALADWPTYYLRVLEGLRQGGRTVREYHDVLDAAALKLPIPWSITYFDDLEKRRVMGGMSNYGWLGHVGAAGMFRKLLANGTPVEKQVIVDAVNRIAAWSHPIDWTALEAELERLMDLKFTMKVWGRFLCLIRPDLYCTVASDSVRANLSKTLQVGQSAFNKPAGYIQLLKLIHSTHWFQASEPSEPAEAAVWRRRVAFMDPIFY